MPKFELNDNIVKNIIEFLRRSRLDGAEVPAFNEIVLALNNPIKEENDKPKDE